MDVRTYGWIDRWTEILPTLQDLVPFRNCCPKSKQKMSLEVSIIRKIKHFLFMSNEVETLFFCPSEAGHVLRFFIFHQKFETQRS